MENLAAQVFFYVAAILAVAGALGVVSFRNPLNSAASLLLTFLAIAGLFLLRFAELIAVVQIFVYGGGIMVLFIFVIMLVNLQRLPQQKLFFEHRWVALALVSAMVVFFGVLLWQGSFPPLPSSPETVEVAPIADLLFTQYLLPFEVASIYLLVAMVGAVILGREGKEQG